jgi:hypothetical protein
MPKIMKLRNRIDIEVVSQVIGVVRQFGVSAHKTMRFLSCVSDGGREFVRAAAAQCLTAQMNFAPNKEGRYDKLRERATLDWSQILTTSFIGRFITNR